MGISVLFVIRLEIRQSAPVRQTMHHQLFDKVDFLGVRHRDVDDVIGNAPALQTGSLGTASRLAIRPEPIHVTAREQYAETDKRNEKGRSGARVFCRHSLSLAKGMRILSTFGKRLHRSGPACQAGDYRETA